MSMIYFFIKASKKHKKSKAMIMNLGCKSIPLKIS